MFRGYPSLETYKQFQKAKQEDCDVIITEKIHGCNLAFILQQGQPIKVQSRNKILEPGEKFYAYERVLDRYKAALSLFENAVCKNKEDMVHVFGEMYGGHYPGQPKVDGAKLVQPRLYYCPDNDFAVFAILVNNKWLTHDQTDNLCGAYGFNIVPEVARCKLVDLDGELKKWSEFSTKVPGSFYKLPDLEGNMAEGVVARCVTADGSLGRMLKFKNAKFSERAFKLTEAQKKERQQEQASSRQLKQECQAYITEARIEAHLSKYGVDDEQVDRVEKIAEDAYQDMASDNPEMLPASFSEFRSITMFKIEGLLKRAVRRLETVG